MAERPLLLFPSRARVSYEINSGGSGKDFKTPSKPKQMLRVDTMFKRINAAFEKHKASIDSAADGLAPEMVLVFETRGSVQEFFRAVAKIPELKWLGEYEEEFPATDDFKYDDNQKKVPGKLFFMLADNAAIRELKSLWGIWKSKKQRFKSGETKWGHLFDLLVDIRPWGIKDRIEETGIRQDLEQRIAENNEIIPFEIELWYRKSKNQRKINKERLQILIAKYGGRIISECDIEEISYQALLAEAPIGIFNELTDETSVSFFKSSDIMYLRPVGQSILEIKEPFETETAQENIPEPQNLLPPLIALLDGMPVQNHLYLKDRLDVYDPDGFEENYPVNGRVHCTGMASVILHGDLNDNNTPLKTKLLVRPVMRYHQVNENQGDEYIPENILLVDLIHKAVKEIIGGSSQNLPNVSSIKVINLSIGDRFRIFDRTMSPWARLIDWLSEKHNLLFVISAGNVYDDIIIDSGEIDINEFLANNENTQKESLLNFYNKNRFRKIIAPAEAMNALTVGAAHEDSNINYALNNLINLYANTDLLSPLSRMGFGYRKSIKPDILAKGGRVLFRNSGNGLLKISRADTLPPGIKVAAPGDAGNRVIYSKGTSNAAAIVSNTAGKIYESFLDDESLRLKLTDEYFAVTAKALLVHSASWNMEAMESIINSISNDQNKRDLISRFLGYGKIQPDKILECTDKRITLIGCETLKPESAYVYDLPLPEILSGTVNWRKLSVTLAWLTPINTNNQLYRTHKLWFDFPGKDYDTKLKAKRIYYNDDSVRRGTVQHEIFYSDKAQAFADNSTLKIKVNCKTDALKYDDLSFKEQKNVKSIKYALIVTLEIDPAIEVDIYTEINNRIRQIIRP